MGKKNKKVVDINQAADSNLAQEADQSRGYVSHKMAAAQEAADANKGQSMMNNDSDEEQKIGQKKKNKRNKGAQELDDFDQAIETTN